MSSADVILVVDDDRAVRALVELTLREEGYTVLTAADGRTALDLAASQRVSLILLDQRMPAMGGGQFLRAYHAGPGPHAPVVLLTAAPDVTGFTAEGVAAHLAKPFDLDELLALVAAHVASA